MFERLSLFSMAQNMATHAAARQNVIAQNVTNSDTPGYKAQDLTALSQPSEATFQMRRTAPQHLLGTTQAQWHRIEIAGQADPNGNTVSLEEEVLRSVDAARAHNRALTIYQSSLGILRSALGRSGG